MNEILKDLDDTLKRDFPAAREGSLKAPTGTSRIMPPEVDVRPKHTDMIDQTIADLQMTIRILETAKKRL